VKAADPPGRFFPPTRNRFPKLWADVDLKRVEGVPEALEYVGGVAESDFAEERNA
jgi:hypothetical protein